MNIVFMGTPEFAIPSLNELLNSKHKILAVVTGPDKQVGRGQKIMPTPIKKFALSNDLKVITPTRLKDEHFISELKKLNADLFVVVAFRILPSAVFLIPPYGTINLHGSILPKYRGAAPINWVIINGETETGLTTFYIEEKVDTGEIILKRELAIGPDETAGDLHDRMSVIGADLLLETVDLVADGRAPKEKQQGEASLAPKITKEICKINWTKNAIEIKNLVRGLSPFPRAFTHLHGKGIKICAVELEQDKLNENTLPGQIIQVDKKGKIVVATGNGVLSITELQPENKRRMSTAEYLRGNEIDAGSVFS